MNIDWGTAPAWGAVFVALVAAIFAGLSARANIRGNRNQQRQLEYQQKQIVHQQQQLEQQQESTRRDQASKIAVWTELWRSRNVVTITNASNLPVYAA